MAHPGGAAPLPPLLLLPGPCPGREDLKHMKQKLKKVEEKMGKDGAKAGELAAELSRLQEEVPALQARAADLEQQLAKAQEVGGRAGRTIVCTVSGEAGSDGGLVLKDVGCLLPAGRCFLFCL